MAVDGDTEPASDPVLPGLTKPQTEISCCGRVFTVAGTDFFQGNRFIVENMASWVVSRCGGGGKFFADIYGGIGLFSIMIAPFLKKGILVEIDRKMTLRAQENFKKNGISNIEAIALPAESMDSCLNCSPDLLIVDPPRPGLTIAAREAVAGFRPDTIIYISCNCATQARDCGFLVKKAGYVIKETVLFDCYPDTHHIESMVLLKKN